MTARYVNWLTTVDFFTWLVEIYTPRLCASSTAGRARTIVFDVP